MLHNPILAALLRKQFLDTKLKIEVLEHSEDLAAIASHPQVDIVMSAIVGSAGLIPTYAAVCAGKRVLLANKESLVAAGKIITDAAKQYGAQLIPVDSEHSAIYQCLPFEYKSLETIGVNKIILTASGGPFLHKTKAELKHVTPEQAIKHPNWQMGRKISVDSATLMNKGLEVIEAHWLFMASANQIEVIVHPQSIIHSMVEYIDGSILAQLGTPDMRTPIAYALSAPDRIAAPSKKISFLELSALSFIEPDLDKFPCLKIALAGLESTASAPLIINASNEIAVEKFLNHQIGFYDIPAMINKALDKFSSHNIGNIDELLNLDSEVRRYCL